MGSSPLPHIAIFPFMAKGHTIPLIHLAHLIHRRHLASLTFFTTPLNAPFLRSSLSGVEFNLIELPFPDKLPYLPLAVESADSLLSSSYFLPFIDAIKLLRPNFERALASLPTVSFLISDGFLSWTYESATKLGIPRVAFYGMGNFASTVITILYRDQPYSGLNSPDKAITLPNFPNLRLTEFDLYPPYDQPNPKGPIFEFFQETMEVTKKSQGIIMNSFYELDNPYFDYWNKSIGPKAWCVGPVCIADKCVRWSKWTDWLDTKAAATRPVLYVSFGTQADVSLEQLQEIAIGLEKSGFDFLWVVRAKEAHLGDGFEERVAERGRVVREWVDQMEILGHESVRGFVSHCGWNSTLEGITAGVPILAWPMMAEQHLNAKLVVDELRIGVRVKGSDGTRDGLVRGEDVERLVKELMEGERGREAAENVKRLKEAARRAVGEGGSSWKGLEAMIDEVGRKSAGYENGV